MCGSAGRGPRRAIPLPWLQGLGHQVAFPKLTGVNFPAQLRYGLLTVVYTDRVLRNVDREPESMRMDQVLVRLKCARKALAAAVGPRIDQYADERGQSAGEPGPAQLPLRRCDHPDKAHRACLGRTAGFTGRWTGDWSIQLRYQRPLPAAKAEKNGDTAFQSKSAEPDITVFGVHRAFDPACHSAGKRWYSCPMPWHPHTKSSPDQTSACSRGLRRWHDAPHCNNRRVQPFGNDVRFARAPYARTGFAWHAKDSAQMIGVGGSTVLSYNTRKHLIFGSGFRGIDPSRLRR